jgi:hypothetical protein
MLPTITVEQAKGFSLFRLARERKIEHRVAKECRERNEHRREL